MYPDETVEQRLLLELGSYAIVCGIPIWVKNNEECHVRYFKINWIGC